jgi:hypothetical protein
MYAGLDSASFPGMHAMNWLKANTNLTWTGYYLAPWGAGKEFKPKWRAALPRLRETGWGIAPIYLGKQPNTLAATLKKRGKLGKERFDGYDDGVEAARFAKSAEFGPASVLYFDLEKYEFTKAWKQYLYGWMEGVMDAGYYPGLYCSHLRADELSNDADVTGYPFMPHPRIWAVSPAGKFGETLRDPVTKGPVTNYHVNPGKYSVATTATSWQYRHNCYLLYVDETNPKKSKTLPWKVDINASIYADPGKW